MSPICYFCDKSFKKNYNLRVHLENNRCKSQLINNYYALNELLAHLCARSSNNDIVHIKDMIKNVNNVNNTVPKKYKKMTSTKCDVSTPKDCKEILSTEVVITQKKKRGRPRLVPVNDCIIKDHGRVFCKILKSCKIDNRKKKEKLDNTEMIKVNSITNLNLKDNQTNLKNLLVSYEKYKGDNRTIMLLNQYIENIIYNKKIPENMCIKYIKKKPPTLVMYMFDETAQQTKMLITRFSCYSSFICDIFLTLLRKELTKEYKTVVNYFKKLGIDEDDDEDENFGYTSQSILFLLDELKYDKGKNNIKNALRIFLNNKLLFDKSMKITSEMYDKFNNGLYKCVK